MFIPRLILMDIKQIVYGGIKLDLCQPPHITKIKATFVLLIYFYSCHSKAPVHSKASIAILVS